MDKLTKYNEQLPAIKEFTKELNQAVKAADLQKRRVAGGEIEYLPISFVEMQLDEMFAGHWQTYEFRYQQIVNEVVGSIILEVIHPVTGIVIKRTGTASVQIMQDANTKVADFIQYKKPNALEMGFPKLEAECIKSAARKLGKYFGRDLNRKFEDEYEKIIEADEMNLDLQIEVDDCKTIPELQAVWGKYPAMRKNKEFIEYVNNRKKQLQ